MTFRLALCTTFLAILLPSLAYASYTPYCKGTQADSIEDAVIQRLVPQFGMANNCEIGDACLAKSALKNNIKAFSITWKKPCGVHQTKNKIKNSKFICKFSPKKSVCCWPLGYERVKKFTLCSDSIFKKK